MKLARQTALVTGGGSGIGLCMAAELSKRGCTVVILGRSRAKLELAKKKHPELHILVADVTEDADLTRVMDTVRSEFPKLSLLINNAGAMTGWDARTGQLASVDAEVATNFSSAVKLTRLALPGLLEQPAAAIVNVTSALAYAPIAAIPVYCAAKAALHSFTVSLRYQLRSTSVEVFELMPSTVATGMSTGRFPGNMLTPEVVALAAVHGIEERRAEIRVGVTSLLRFMTRLAPSLIGPTLLKTPFHEGAPLLPQRSDPS